MIAGAMMRVLIVGAGPAGLTLALSLVRQGIVPEVVERAAGLNTGGYVVGLQANGWDVAERLGILPALRASALPAADAVYRDGAGRELFRYREDRVRAVTQGKMLHVPRDVLVARLAEALAEQGLAPRFGRSVTALAEEGEQARVTFSDGMQARFDLVVGADGTRSQLRTLAFGPHAGFVRPLGYLGAAWRMADAHPMDPPYEGYMEVGRQAILYQSAPGEISTLLCWRSDELGQALPEARHALVRTAFSGTNPVLERLIDGPVDWHGAWLDSLCQIEMPCWSRGRVVMTGDAAWSLSFLSGQGASMAMAGGYLLAEELGRLPLAAALAAYEARLRPTISRVQKQARATARSYVPRSKAGLWLSRVLLPLLMSPLLLKWRARSLVEPSLMD